MTAFATPQDLADRLNRTFTPDEAKWIGFLLEDASDYLRSIIRYDLYPRRQATFTGRPDASGEVWLPQQPVVSVDAVTRNGLPVSYTLLDQSIKVDGPVDVTFTFGYDEAPEELRRWACVLVSQTLLPLERGLGLTVGGLSSVALDDFRMAFADGGEHTGMQLLPRNEAVLRERFGPGGIFVGGTR